MFVLVNFFVFWIIWVIFCWFKVEVFWIVIFWVLLVVLFIVVICKILLVLILKDICICGIFCGVGGILVSLNFLRDLLLVVIFCFFWIIWILIKVWLFFAVEKILECLIGIVVFWGISFFIIFLIVFKFIDNGVIFKSSIFCILLVKILVWIAVFIVIILLGFIFWFVFLFIRE